MNDLALRAEEHDPQSSSHTPGSAETNGGETATSRSTLFLIGAATVGAAISLSLGMYGRFHTPTGLTVDPIQPQNLLQFKSTLASIGAALAIFQLLSAARLYGRGPSSGPAPSWLGPAHRWSGTAAFVATLPVAYHCIWSLGFQTTSTRVIIHSLLGCAFYGAFATKLLVLRSRRMPGWALPIVGATVVTVLVGLWFSSALWYFTGSL